MSALGSTSTQILVSNIILQERESEVLGEQAESRTGAGKLQTEPGASYVLQCQEASYSVKK